MNILFITLLDIRSIYERNIYSDLMREFVKYGNNIYIISPLERRNKLQTILVKDEKVNILKLKTGNIQKVNMIEKGISTFLLEHQVKRGVKKYFGDVKFDLVLYSTPPITLQAAVSYVKKRDKAVTYLMLKDIFPQNAVDMGILSKTGIKGIVYCYFRKKEKRLYMSSDHIGCMSEANVQYVREHNGFIVSDKIEICPNCIEPSINIDAPDEKEQKRLRDKYEIPQDKTIFVYGGNLGKPQGIDFIINCMKAIEHLNHVFVLIIGSGTEYKKLQCAIKENNLKNTKVHKYMPKEEYDGLLKLCQVGLIFLDHRFTIPNFPSRLLSYMDAELPVFAVVDEVTDVGKIIERGDFGWSCQSKDVDKVVGMFDTIGKSMELESKGKNGKQYLCEHYNANIAYRTIVSHLVHM